MDQHAEKWKNSQTNLCGHIILKNKKRKIYTEYVTKQKPCYLKKDLKNSQISPKQN